MVERPLDHEHLRSIRARREHRSAMPPAGSRRSRSPMLPRARTLKPVDARESVADAIRDHGPDHVRGVHGARALGPGRILRAPTDRPRRPFRHEPARPSRLRGAPRAARSSISTTGSASPPVPAVGGGGRRRHARPAARRAPADLDVTYTAIETSPGARAALEAIDGVEVAERAGRLAAADPGERADGQPALPASARDGLRDEGGPGRPRRGSVRRAPRRSAARRGPRPRRRRGGGPPRRGDGVHRGGGGPARPPGLRAPDRLRRGGRAGRPAPRVPGTPTGRGPPRPAGRDRHHLRARLRSPQPACGERRG